MAALVATSAFLLAPTAVAQEEPPPMDPPPTDPPQHTTEATEFEAPELEVGEEPRQTTPETEEVGEEPQPAAPLEVPQEAERATVHESAPTNAAEDARSEQVAQEPLPLDIAVSAFSRFELREGYERLGVSRGRFMEGDTTVYRTRLGLRTRPVELGGGMSALLQFTPQASGQYGTTATVGVQDVGLYEGYLRLQGAATALDVGRFQLDYGESLVLGNLDWHQTGRAFEGARVRHALELGWIDAFVTQTPRAGETTAEGHPLYNRPVFAGDTYLWGLYAALGGYVNSGMDLDVYVLGLSSAKTRDVPRDPEDPAAGTFTKSSATELTLGVRLKDQLSELVDYRLEAGLQTGSRPSPADGGDTARSVLAYQGDGEFGLSPIPQLRVALGGAYATGDDPSSGRDEGWNELYPTGHRWLGLMDVAGSRNNIASANAKVSAQPFDATSMHVDFHHFRRLHVTADLERDLGSELDVYIIRKLGKAFAARALYGVFVPNEGHFGTREPAHYTEAELKLSF